MESGRVNVEKSTTIPLDPKEQRRELGKSTVRKGSNSPDKDGLSTCYGSLLLLPNELFRSKSPKPFTKSTLSATHCFAGRDYRLALEAYLSPCPDHTSFLHAQMLGKGKKEGVTFSAKSAVGFEEKKATPMEEVKTEYCAKLASVVGLEGTGIIRKGMKLGKNPGVVILKSAQLQWTADSPKRQPKDIYVHFPHLPLMLHLPNGQLIRELARFITWDTNGEFGINQPKSVKPSTAIRKHYSKEPRIFQISKDGKLHQLCFKYNLLNINL